MKPRALPILAIAALALVGCSNNGNNDSQDKSSAPTTYDAPSGSYDDYGSDMPSTPSNGTPSFADASQRAKPFTTDDALAFITDDGATGTLEFGVEAPQDLDQATKWAGKNGGTWMALHIDNRKGSDPISNVTATMLDSDGNKYNVNSDSGVAALLYGDSTSSDPHSEAYGDLYMDYDQSNIEPGEVRDMYMYSEKALPHQVQRGTISAGYGADAPLTIQK